MKLLTILLVSFVSLKTAAVPMIGIAGHFKGRCDVISSSQTYSKDGSKKGDVEIGHQTILTEDTNVQNGETLAKEQKASTSIEGGPSYQYSLTASQKTEKVSRNIERDTVTYNEQSRTVIEEYKIETDGSKTLVSGTDDKGKVRKFKGYSNQYVTPDGSVISLSNLKSYWLDLPEGERKEYLSSKTTCVSHPVK